MTLRLSAAVMFVGAALASQPALAHKSHDTADVLTAVIIGAAAGALLGAIDDGEKHPNHRPHDDHVRPAYGSGPYMVTRGVTCFPRQQVCRRADNSYAPKWTHREFGR